MERKAYTLKDRATRDTVVGIIANLPLGTRVEIGEETRTQRQNRAIHGLIGQIMKQRPEHRGIVMTMEAYKAAFMHGLGREIDFIPSLDGKGMVPLGLSTSALSVTDFNQLVEFVLAWAANEGLTIRHFDGQGGAEAKNLRAEAA
jgi:hypothetical protein